jgi:hypothetical protein
MGRPVAKLSKKMKINSDLYLQIYVTLLLQLINVQTKTPGKLKMDFVVNHWYRLKETLSKREVFSTRNKKH